MTAVGWLVWAASIWAVWFAYCASDLPDLVQSLATRYRHGSTR